MQGGRMMAKYTRQDIVDLIDDEDIEFIRLQFTDISGNLKNMATTIDQLDKILDGHYKFDCAAIEGFRGTGYEELFLVPDLDTFVIFPGVHSMARLHAFYAMLSNLMVHRLTVTADIF